MGSDRLLLHRGAPASPSMPAESRHHEGPHLACCTAASSAGTCSWGSGAWRSYSARASVNRVIDRARIRCLPMPTSSAGQQKQARVQYEPLAHSSFVRAENKLAYQFVYESQGAQAPQSDVKLTPQLLAGQPGSSLCWHAAQGAKFLALNTAQRRGSSISHLHPVRAEEERDRRGAR